MTTYTIGDIHGQLGMLEDTLALIEKDGGSAARIVFLGDYVDRGANSKGVIDLFLRGQAEGRDWIFIKGNHDRMFQRFVETGKSDDERILSGKRWLHERLGGVDTLNSYLDTTELLQSLNAPSDQMIDYGIDPIPQPQLGQVLEALRAAIPETHLRFLEGLQLNHIEDGKFFVHAGVRPGVPLSLQQEDDMLWVRDEFLPDTRDHGALIVHGHSPVETDYPDLRPNRLNMDTGAGYGRPLSAAVFEGDQVLHLTAKGRVPL
ncbi:metallophosphoesterase [Primorskyibacter sp. 2E233]|uniref:metallophosphoesterase n=1 Tax=Primorskyibacter sp. 2E233 TaxID=3413431 RepID=UPI003BF182B5